MPLYDFQCPTCGVIREVPAKAGDRHVVIVCERQSVPHANWPACQLTKLPSAPYVFVPMKHRAVE